MRLPQFSTLAILYVMPFALWGSDLQISLNQIPARVKNHHPSLIAARLSIEEARARVLSSGRWSNPEVEVSFLHDDRFREGTLAASFTQAFPLTSRLRLEKQISQQEVTAAELEFADQTRLMIAEAQSLAVKLLSLDQQQSLRQQQLELARKLSEFAADRAQKGELSPLDAAQAQVDSQQLILENRKLQAERTNLLGELKPKLGLSPADTLQITGSMPEILLPAVVNGSQRPDYQLHQLRQQSAQTEIALSKAKKWQDIEAGLLWEGERAVDEPGGLERTGFFGFQISIPLPLWNRNQGEIAEKTASATRKVLETKALNSNIQHELRSLRQEMQSYADLAKETKEQLLPLVIEQSNRMEQAYQTGQTDLISLLRVREQKLQLETAVLEAQRDFHLARIRYESASAKHVRSSAISTNK